MIFEGVITTADGSGQAHVTPMGFRRECGRVVVAPFEPSKTLENLDATGRACMNLTDEVRVLAGCLTGRRDWSLVRAERIDGWRLENCLAHLELEVVTRTGPGDRPRFELDVVGAFEHRPYPGYNRARGAVFEAAILVSRLDFIDPAKLASEMTYLHIAISKTAGPDEFEAWHWLLDAVAAHPRHLLDVAPLRQSAK